MDFSFLANRCLQDIIFLNWIKFEFHHLLDLSHILILGMCFFMFSTMKFSNNLIVFSILFKTFNEDWINWNIFVSMFWHCFSMDLLNFSQFAFVKLYFMNNGFETTFWTDVIKSNLIISWSDSVDSFLFIAQLINLFSKFWLMKIKSMMELDFFLKNFVSTWFHHEHWPNLIYLISPIWWCFVSWLVWQFLNSTIREEH